MDRIGRRLVDFFAAEPVRVSALLRLPLIALLEDVGRPASQALLYRAARELLTNVGKHAQPTAVQIRLSREGGRIVLVVADDGAGFGRRSLISASRRDTSDWRRCKGDSTRWAGP